MAPLHLIHRPRRLRQNATLRSLVRETTISTDDLMWPVFVTHGEVSELVATMPGVRVHSIGDLQAAALEAKALGIRGVLIFPKLEPPSESLNERELSHPNCLVAKAIRAIKTAAPGLIVGTDVALDCYTKDGHDGIRDDSGQVANDRTVHWLCKQALCHADAGADLICPSDMMDGRVAAIRSALEAGGHSLPIMSYTAKYASALYGPFRDALGTKRSHMSKAESAVRPSSDTSKGYSCDRFKSSYQMDISNSKEAMREAALDVEEGADILMVKPGLFNLDIVRRVADMTNLPVAVYHVSGEYAMIKAAAGMGALDEIEVVMEALKAMKRAGADIIVTYYAVQVAGWMAEGKIATVKCF